MDTIFPFAMTRGHIPGLSYTESRSVPLPGPEWLRLRPLLSGICGSDVALLAGRSGPALSPFTSFPAILGHEVVAEVIECGSEALGVDAGDRVVVDPFISCQMRDLEPCPFCSSGQRCLCTQSAEGALAPGMLIGFCRDLPGSWSEEMVVHREQVYRVPTEITDDRAVLVEPFSVALHAVLKLPPEPGSRVLVLGGGTVGLLVLSALRLLKIDCHVTVVARYPIQAAMARKLGADVVHGRAEDAAIDVTKAKPYRPLRGRRVYTGGFDWIYDCVGTARTVDESMRVARPDGKVIMVGCAGEVSRLDLSFVWARELHITGCYGYSQERDVEGQPHTFDIALDLLKDNPDYPLTDLVTHRFSLANWAEAVSANLRRERSGAIKTIFDCRAGAENAKGAATTV
jgi:L-iditol 2-dehydrogenase